MTVDKAAKRTRRRFVIAHEFGHCELHPTTGHAKLLRGMELTNYSAGEREPAANEFAAEFLMPEKQFRLACDVKTPRIDVIEGISRK